ncbi:MAG TPA: polyamine aminopropyltransferase [Methylomusa anaerophila]|uniref:Polyamine aminopropyltransferase n=1 Tax=Methylomusa anaerophila TaxID=1930071 RepID=A0A348AG34_9FIRM|nr:polyamine aminopropyltransferase [Methylomusa anaerophila]BBB90032.1 spermidine synthase [Methylomusa anaerophila]HML88240.1 polyamine aminopropyltransferase [Methylomusa anaerophila]
MELWYTEFQTKNLGLTTRIKETLFAGKSKFQEVAVVESLEFGRMLVLDGVFQTSVFDEFIYHEMIAHVPLFSHPNPRKVLIIGGGDGGTVREVVKHQSIEKAEMVEIDGMVVDVCKKYLPEISIALNGNHPKLELKIGDGIKHMQQAENLYDVIIVDCSDPIGPGEGLFTRAFYKDVYKALKPDGLFVQQTESPFYHQELVKRLHQDISSLFPIIRLYLASIPLYPGGLHCFTIGSKQYDPTEADVSRIPATFGTRYHNVNIQKSCFALPNFVQELIK